MAALTQTITNAFNVFGGGPSTKWGEFNWGEAKWGEGTLPMTFAIGKLIENSQAFVGASLTFSAKKLISETLLPTGDLVEQTLKDSAGYYHVFVKPSIDAEDRSLTTYATAGGGSATYTSVGGGSATWTEV